MPNDCRTCAGALGLRKGQTKQMKWSYNSIVLKTLYLNGCIPCTGNLITEGYRSTVGNNQGSHIFGVLKFRGSTTQVHVSVHVTVLQINKQHQKCLLAQIILLFFSGLEETFGFITGAGISCLDLWNVNCVLYPPPQILGFQEYE